MKMTTEHFKRFALFSAASAIAAFSLITPAAEAQSSLGFPLQASSFQQAAPRGFGDRNNSWAQSMIWWHNNLYVGTSRQSLCTSYYALNQYVGINVSPSFANTYFTYPPVDPDISCPPDGADLSLQAEIWRWSPVTSSWTRVFQSPASLDNPGGGSGLPARPGKKVPYEITIRGFAPYTEADGTEALYAMGVNSTIVWDRTKLPPPRILRTTDGNNFTAIPQTPGTFLYDLPFNPDHSSFRSAVSYGGKLFALCGPAFGQGALIASANPSAGNDTWFLAGPAGIQFYEVAVFNGWLYLGGFDPTGGYAVYKTQALGAPPYALTTVIPSGAYLPTNPSASVVSMHVYFGRLFVGTATFTEIVRINPDDTWDLVVGAPRLAPAPGGGTEYKNPISNLDAGFGHTLNDHAWQMDDPYRFLYVGTYNASTASRLQPINGPALLHNMGAHLYQTPDSWYYTPITTTGFATNSPISNTAYASPYDPHGGIFDFGIRSMASTPYGAFLGTTNDYYGLEIFRATKRPSPLVDPPNRLEVEPGNTGSAILSWTTSTYAKTYQIWRAERTLILVRDSVNFEGNNSVTGNKIPDVQVGPYTQIGVSSTTTFVDTSVQPGKRYMYYVAGVGAQGFVSDPSSLTSFPLLLPSITFSQLLTAVDRLDQRQRFRAPDVHGTAVRAQITAAQASAAACQIATAISQLNPQTASRATLDPESVDIQIQISKMIRRLQVYSIYSSQLPSAEFCPGR